MIAKYRLESMQNFRLISLVVSEIDAFKRDLPPMRFLCIILQARDFSEILDGCKFCIINEINFEFSVLPFWISSRTMIFTARRSA